MSNQVLVQFRVDGELKKEVTEIYNALGLDLPTAFRMFMMKTKIERGLPFSAVLPDTNTTSGAEAFEALRREAADVPEMSLDEINDLITEVRNSRRN